MENTLENKEKFFAQYWGQKILHDIVCEKPMQNINENWSCTTKLAELDYLQLKSLSSITDEEAEIISEIVYAEFTTDKVDYGRRYIKDYFLENSSEFMWYVLDEIIQINDFLRSKGYALPWMKLSIEKQIEFGWIKLRENIN